MLKPIVFLLISGLFVVMVAYGGDGSFAPIVSAAHGQTLDPPIINYRPVAILLATIVVAALLVLLRGAALTVVRQIFRWLLRPIWLGVRYVFRRIGAALRFMRILSKTQSQRPADTFLGLSVGTIAQALTETDKAIEENFDPSTVAIDRHRRLVCFWLHPVAQNKSDLATQHKGDYEKTQAEEDFKKAEIFFNVDVPRETNALNLYDDVHNAFIVNLFKNSDKRCFYVLSEFRKAINSNVTMLSVIFSLIVSVVAALNVLWSRSVDFYKLAGVPQGRWLPPPSRISAWSSRHKASSILPFSAPVLVQSASA